MIKQYPESSFLPNLDSDTFLKIFFLESIREFCADEVDGTFKLNKPPDPETSGGFQKNGYDGGRSELFLRVVIRFRYTKWAVNCIRKRDRWSQQHSYNNEIRSPGKILQNGYGNTQRLLAI